MSAIREKSESAIRNFMLAKAWNILSLPLTIFCLVKGLNADEQGYYTTFASIQSIQLLFELGMTGVIGQFVAHEKAHLTEESNGEMAGDANARNRLGAIISFAFKYILTAALASLVVLMIGGYFFFSSTARLTSGGVVWLEPWLLISLGTCFGMVSSTCACIADGLGGVAHVHRIALRQNFAGNLVLWIGLAAGAKLYSPALQSLTVSAVGLYFYWSRYHKIILNLLRQSRDNTSSFSWRRELWPLQWRISCSWLSGVLISQLASPVIFRTWGPAVAGSYGLTLRCLEALSSLGNGWISTRAAIFGTLISRKKYPELFNTFQDALKKSTSFYFAGASAFVLVIWILSRTELMVNGTLLSGRFLPLSLILVLILCYGIQLIIGSIAALTRAEKKEPFFWPSIIIAVLSVSALFRFGITYGVIGVAYSTLCIHILFGLPVSIVIYRRFLQRTLHASRL